MSCIDFENLVAYWLGEVEAEPLEEHLFACAQCSARLEEVAALGQGVRAAVRAGTVALAVSAPFVEAMKGMGLRVREYRVPRNGSVDCTLRADEHAVVSRLAAPLAGVKRLDALKRVEVGGEISEVRIENVPFDPDAGEVLFLPSAAGLRKLPAHTQRIRLVAVDEAGERAIGEYTFVHTPG